MKKILLNDSVGFGLIINLPTGILFSNQTGGTACLQPEIEGLFIPIANDIFTESNALYSPETELTQYFLSPKYAGTGACNGIDCKDVAAIEAILEKYSLQDFITIDSAKLSESHESWIWVKININSENNLLLKNFEKTDLIGVITWCNSD
uniref:DUF6210 family protein n=1 Tax=Flavobacterium sp. TaxID=239 RepID=UPI00404990EB